MKKPPKETKPSSRKKANPKSNGRGAVGHAGSGSLRSPLHWYGSKHYLRHRIIPLFPRHRVFVDVFGGGASVLLGKPPSPIEVYNDRDSRAHNFFRVLADPDLRLGLAQKTGLTPYSRRLLEKCIALSETGSIGDPMEAAWAFLVCCNQAWNGVGERSSDFSYSKTKSSRGMSDKTSAWRALPQVIAEAGDRLQQAIIENLPWDQVIARYDSDDTLLYLDPPYLPETRKRKQAYAHEMSYGNHVRLLGAVREVNANVALSGYANDLYDELLWDWTRIELETCARAGARTAGGKRPRRTEVLWLNYRLQKAPRPNDPPSSQDPDSRVENARLVDTALAQNSFSRSTKRVRKPLRHVPSRLSKAKFRRQTTPPARSGVRVAMGHRQPSSKGSPLVLAENKLYQGNCLDVLKDIENGRIDLIVTSPPYFVEKQYERTATFCEYHRLMEASFMEWCRVLKPGGYAVVNFGDYFNSGNRFYDADIPACYPAAMNYYKWGVEMAGMDLQATRIWRKKFAKMGIPFVCNTHPRPIFDYEYVWTFRKKNGSRNEFVNDRKLSQRGVIGDDWTSSARIDKHCAAFPIELPLWAIRVYSQHARDLVLDPFAGSGTTGVACRQLGRKFILIEKETKYYDMASQRLERAAS